MFVHANLSWNLGPFRYLFVSPVFHRWHHASAEGVNFANTFTLWDWMFGTFYLPEGVLPQNYGIDDNEMPDGLLPQMLYPLLQRDSAPGSVGGLAIPEGEAG